ncbi:unnamed protein product [Staurois parvus]|uniref:Uncharacterized protein n=1 Tax=Staurois parvus TaxID=386267 RepID=A0ABN9DXN0_9NEOB|nr:unnamed protein product [Staurois parvus]
MVGMDLKQSPGQVTTSEQAHQWLRRPLGTGTGRARYKEDGGPQQGSNGSWAREE